MSRKENAKAIRRLQDAEYDYACWIQENENRPQKFRKKSPLFSIVLFKNGATEEQKKRCLSSINKQTCKNIDIIEFEEEQVEWKKLCQQLKGEYVVFVHMTDVIAPNTLAEFAKMIEEHPEAQWIYADEDVYREEDGVRVLPHFKPDWSYDTFLSFFYTGNAAVFKIEICSNIKDWTSQLSYYWSYDFALHFLEICNQSEIYHISKVLYHVSDIAIEKSKAERIETKSIKEDYLKRQAIDATVELEERTGEYRIVYNGDGLVSIIIPSKDNVDMLTKCICSIEKNTSYTEYEIIVVDNGSCAENKEKIETFLKDKKVAYIYKPQEFNFSKMCNIGASASNGEYLLFLNDDIECVDDKWLSRMVGLAAQSGVGAVGAKLLYPDKNKIQHIGVINFDFEVGPSHILAKQSDEGVLEHGRNCLDYDYEAVTAACLLIKKDKYKEVEGFDEELPIAYNDVDFCYKVREYNYRNVVRTDAVLIHHESISRGIDAVSDEKMRRLVREREYLYKKHPWILDSVDRAFNINFALDERDCRLATTKKTAGYNQKVWPRPYAEASYYVIIERMVKEQDLQIDGWYWYSDDTYTNLSDIYVVFRDEKTKKEIWYNTCKKTRYDAKEILNNDAFYCGFTCKISKTEMEKLHGYKVGICAKLHDFKRSPLMWTENIIG